MGRQAYLTRVCLGRSALEPLIETVAADDETQALRSSADNPEVTTEPVNDFTRQVDSGSYQQQYDRKGYPENPTSRALSRQSRRAINDILTTVGVCVGVDPDGQIRPVDEGSLAALDKSKVNGIIRENDIGILIGLAEEFVDDLASMWTMGLRNRLQTFRFYSGVPLTSIVKSEWRHLGFLRGLCAGIPAGQAFIFLNTGRFIGIEVVNERLSTWLGPPSDSGFMRGIKWFLSENAGRLLNLTIRIGFLAPIRIYSMLQHQGLLPARPLLPYTKAFIPFSPSSPLRLSYLPDRLDGASCLRFLASLAVNPVVLLGIQMWMRALVQPKIQKYARAALPAPDFPDVYSVQAAIEDNMDRDIIPGLGNATDTPELWESRSLTEELAKDLQSIGRTSQILYDKFWALFSSKSQESEPLPTTEQISLPTPTPASSTSPLGDDDPSPPSPSRSYDPSSTTSSSYSYPSTPNPQIEITHSGSSTPTVHMRVALPVPLPRRARLHDPRSSPSAPDGPNNINGSYTYHRITLLTAQAADSMAQHLSRYIIDILFFPLEALTVRSVALSFLSSPAGNIVGAKTVAERWKGQVYPLGAWFGMGLRSGGWRGVVDYAGKMVLVRGLEMGIGVAVWQVTVGFSWWVGKRWFGWGRL